MLRLASSIMSAQTNLPKFNHMNDKTENLNKMVSELVKSGATEEARILMRKAGLKHHPELASEETEKWLTKFITIDTEMIQMKSDIRRLSNVDDTVLIVGESGTGKEIIAHALHGGRDEGKFIPINCAALPENLIESELFGHIQGAFTGATQTKDGLFTAAGKGTVFLDEIGELSLPMQAKFLRAIQEKTIRRIGANDENKIYCRIIAGTHQNLSAMVKEKLFRLDLFQRLSRFEVATKPLVQRRDDIPEMIKKLDEEAQLPDEIIEKIKNWSDLSGNVRTVENLVRRYIVLGRLD